MIKACIFDLDGTLGDTRASIIYSVKETLKEMNLPAITKEQTIAFVGNGARCLMERTLEATGEGNISRIEEGMEVYSRIFDEFCTKDIILYDGIGELLKSLKEKGIRLCVLSNKPHKQTVKVVEAMCGEGVFEIVQGQMDSIKRKPDPAGVHYIIQKLGISLDECLYAGDSEVDAMTGNNAGVKTVCVSWGFRDKSVLENAGAKIIIDRPEEFVQYL